jgi:hypothetical protein
MLFRSAGLRAEQQSALDCAHIRLSRQQAELCMLGQDGEAEAVRAIARGATSARLRDPVQPGVPNGRPVWQRRSPLPPDPR